VICGILDDSNHVILSNFSTARRRSITFNPSLHHAKPPSSFSKTNRSTLTKRSIVHSRAASQGRRVLGWSSAAGGKVKSTLRRLLVAAGRRGLPPIS
jgi:hypothetical protein